MVIYLRWSAFLKVEFARENYYESFPDAESWLVIEAAADMYMYIKALIWKSFCILKYINDLAFHRLTMCPSSSLKPKENFYLLVWHVLVCPINDSLDLWFIHIPLAKVNILFDKLQTS